MNFDFHSPEEELHFPVFREKNIRVFVKRDDLIHPYISGNKWRKLKYTLTEALESDKKHLVTFGGAWSNHLLATACAGAKFGFRTTGFVRGERVVNPVLSLCRMFGMQLIFVSRDQYLDKTALFSRHFDIETDFYIEEGGFGKSAVRGCAELPGELHHHYEHMLIACGTGASVAGILRGVRDHGLSTQVHGIPVLKNGDFILREMHKIIENPQEISFHTQYHFGGYAKIKPELIDFMRQFSAATGMMLDPVYTGKMFFAAFDLIRRGEFRSGDNVLLIHTGGLTGFLGMYNHFDKAVTD